MNDISIIGAGSFGTALAIALARSGKSVGLWGRNPDHVALLGKARENIANLSGYPFPDGIETLHDLGDATTAPVTIIAVPMQALASLLRENQSLFQRKILVAACKGVDLASGLSPHDLIAKAGGVPALLSGPSFAVDIAAGLPTALTIAASTDDAAMALQQQLACDSLRLYRSDDMTGVAIGGAIKNVMALASGMTIGAGLGESARAALLTRAYAEMQRFAIAQGARAETLAGLSGFGDLILTCTSPKSRNFSHGLALGSGAPPPKATVEGIATAKAVSNLAKNAQISMPITDAVTDVLDAKITISEAMTSLLSRPLTKE